MSRVARREPVLSLVLVEAYGPLAFGLELREATAAHDATAGSNKGVTGAVESGSKAMRTEGVGSS
jgi:hypothetical protein